jgi:hypothetical protein
MLFLAVILIPLTAYSQESAMPQPSYVTPRADGNRISAGRGGLPSEPRRIELPGRPEWVIGVESGAAWLVALNDGQVIRVSADGEFVENVAQRAAGQPPYVTSEGLLGAVEADASPLGYAVNYEGIAYYVRDTDGRIVRADDGRVWQKDAEALADARLSISEGGLLAVYVQPTDRYPHGVFGDETEAGALQVYDLRGGRFELSGQVILPPEHVFEGLAPLWGDLDDDGVPELITTVSDSFAGARIVVYALRPGTGAPGLFNLDVLAEGQAIGQGNRWRHQIAVGAFGPQGQTELVVVRTPHIGGIVEFHRLEDGRLNILATLSGYTSHEYRSRNLEMAQAGDFDGDGRVELAVPTQDRAFLAGIIHDGETGAGREVWRVALNGHAVSNLASLTRSDGTLTVALGLEENVLLVWD